jgi:arylamine N-acetyltransferase
VLESFNEKPNDPNTRWNQIYIFSETEYFQCDFEAMSYFVSTHAPSPESHFSTLRDVMMLKKYFWLEGQQDVLVADKHLGVYYLIGNSLKRAAGQEVEEIKEVETEEERIELIKQYFDVDIDRDGINYVRGRKVALAQA